MFFPLHPGVIQQCKLFCFEKTVSEIFNFFFPAAQWSGDKKNFYFVTLAEMKNHM